MFKHTNQKERAQSGPRLPHEHANETRRGKWATVASSQRGQTLGEFIADAICMTQVHYRKTGELKGGRETRTERSGGKRSINTIVLSESANENPESESN